jgi:hypothetical protein
MPRTLASVASAVMAAPISPMRARRERVAHLGSEHAHGGDVAVAGRRARSRTRSSQRAAAIVGGMGKPGKRAA